METPVLSARNVAKTLLILRDRRPRRMPSLKTHWWIFLFVCLVVCFFFKEAYLARNALPSSSHYRTVPAPNMDVNNRPPVRAPARRGRHCPAAQAGPRYWACASANGRRGFPWQRAGQREQRRPLVQLTAREAPDWRRFNVSQSLASPSPSIPVLALRAGAAVQQGRRPGNPGNRAARLREQLDAQTGPWLSLLL